MTADTRFAAAALRLAPSLFSHIRPSASIMSVHTIRLAGPWELHQEGADPVRVQLPFEFPPDDPSTRLLRRFHRPSGLTDGSRVRIVLKMTQAPGSVLVNDLQQSLGETARTTEVTDYICDVTSQLQSFNSICIHSGHQPSAAVALQAAVMEIHEA